MGFPGPSARQIDLVCYLEDAIWWFRARADLGSGLFYFGADRMSGPPGSTSIPSVATQIASSGVADVPPISMHSNSDFIPALFR
jgi:hypothetical protein